MSITKKSIHLDIDIFLWSNIVPVIMVKVFPQSLHLYRISPAAVLPYLMILVLLHSLHVLGVNELRRTVLWIKRKY